MGRPVRCLVTFYGVPLRIGKLEPTPAESAEFATLAAEADRLVGRLSPIVDRAGSVAAAAGKPVPQLPGFGHELTQLIQRLDVTQVRIRQAAPDLNASEQQALAETAKTLQAMLYEPVEHDLVPLTDAERQRMQVLAKRLDQPDDRQELQDLARRVGLIDYARVLSLSLKQLDPEQSRASFDSELATLRLDLKPATLWLANPLRGRNPDAQDPPNVMRVARLDAPTPDLVRQIIDDSIATEQEGLDGRLVIDSRGLRMPGKNGKPDGYAPFDEQLRRLAAQLRTAATLDVVHDDQADVFQRGPANTPAVTDVAVYVGWYRLRDYNRPFEFTRGAIGYHVASYELAGLRNPNERGWVAGLLRDGMVATVGPTSEPYLSAFPPPAQFVPLMLSGRMTLGDAYWMTVPQVSWQMVLIGDPLYRPFAERPALRLSGTSE
jgi:uncharacterized protein (TIGR03790 family)